MEADPMMEADALWRRREEAVRQGTRLMPGTSFTEFLGRGDPAVDDPAEAFHEAAKMTATTPPTLGAQLLEVEPEIRSKVRRSVKRHPHLPSVALPTPSYPKTTFESVVRGRRSRRDFGPQGLSLTELATVLYTAYGVTGDARGPEGSEDQPLAARSVPSGGALYPLEIYLVARDVERLAAGLYHYDPLEHTLEVIREQEADPVLERLIAKPPAEFGDPVDSCAVAFFLIGIFWRSRFKYWLRGYQFALLEAGHVVQNLLLGAEAVGVNAFANGGFWDRRVDEFIGVDGVNESVVYTVLAGSRPEGTGGEAT
jgi:SagB-type dehydrogenase family enzyme